MSVTPEWLRRLSSGAATDPNYGKIEDDEAPSTPLLATSGRPSVPRIPQVGSGFQPVDTDVTAPAPEPEPFEPQPLVPALTPQGEPSAGVNQWDDLVQEASETYGVPPSVIKGIMDLESGGDPTATSPAQARGLMQIMDVHWNPDENPYDPRTNIFKGTKLLADHYTTYGDWDKAAAAYYGAIDYNTGEINDSSDISGVTGPQYTSIFNERRAKYLNDDVNMTAPSTAAASQAEQDPDAKWQAETKAGSWASEPVQGPPAPLTPPDEEPPLTTVDAYLAAGPAATEAFYRMYGRNPTASEARGAAQAVVDWRAEQSADQGPQLDSELIATMGGQAEATPELDATRMVSALEQGNAVVLETPQRYAVISGYDPSSSQFFFGESGSALGGQPWMTLDEFSTLAAADGGVRGALYREDPTTQTSLIGSSSPSDEPPTQTYGVTPPQPESTLASTGDPTESAEPFRSPSLWSTPAAPRRGSVEDRRRRASTTPDVALNDFPQAGLPVQGPPGQAVETVGANYPSAARKPLAQQTWFNQNIWPTLSQELDSLQGRAAQPIFPAQSRWAITDTEAAFSDPTLTPEDFRRVIDNPWVRVKTAYERTLDSTIPGNLKPLVSAFGPTSADLLEAESVQATMRVAQQDAAFSTRSYAEQQQAVQRHMVLYPTQYPVTLQYLEQQKAFLDAQAKVEAIEPRELDYTKIPLDPWAVYSGEVRAGLADLAASTGRGIVGLELDNPLVNRLGTYIYVSMARYVRENPELRAYAELYKDQIKLDPMEIADDPESLGVSWPVLAGRLTPSIAQNIAQIGLIVGLNLATRGAISRGLAPRAALEAVRAFGQGLTVLSTYLSESGERFGDALSKGVDWSSARNVGIAAGAINAAVEVGIDWERAIAFKLFNRAEAAAAKDTMKTTLAQNGGKAAKDLALAMSGEAAEEGLQNTWGQMLTQTYDKLANLFDNLGASVMMGALGGGAMGAPGALKTTLLGAPRTANAATLTETTEAELQALRAAPPTDQSPEQAADRLTEALVGEEVAQGQARPMAAPSLAEQTRDQLEQLSQQAVRERQLQTAAEAEAGPTRAEQRAQELLTNLDNATLSTLSRSMESSPSVAAQGWVAAERARRTEATPTRPLPEVTGTPDQPAAVEPPLPQLQDPAEAVAPEAAPAPSADPGTAVPPEAAPAPRARLDPATLLPVTETGQARVVVVGPAAEIQALETQVAAGQTPTLRAGMPLRLYSSQPSLTRGQAATQILVDPAQLQLETQTTAGRLEYRPLTDGVQVQATQTLNAQALPFPTTTQIPQANASSTLPQHAERGFGGLDFTGQTATAPLGTGLAMYGQVNATPQPLLAQIGQSSYAQRIARAVQQQYANLQQLVRAGAVEGETFTPSRFLGLAWMPGYQGTNQVQGVDRETNAVLLNVHEILRMTLNWAAAANVAAWSPEFNARLAVSIVGAQLHEQAHDLLNDHNEDFDGLVTTLLRTARAIETAQAVFSTINALSTDEQQAWTNDLQALMEGEPRGQANLRDQSRGDAALGAASGVADAAPGTAPPARAGDQGRPAGGSARPARAGLGGAAAVEPEPARGPDAVPGAVPAEQVTPARDEDPARVPPPSRVNPAPVDPELYLEIQGRARAGEFGAAVWPSTLADRYQISLIDAGAVTRQLRADGTLGPDNRVAAPTTAEAELAPNEQTVLDRLVGRLEQVLDRRLGGTDGQARGMASEDTPPTERLRMSAGRDLIRDMSNYQYSGEPLPRVAMKELIQNAVDATREAIRAGRIPQGLVDVTVDLDGVPDWSDLQTSVTADERVPHLVVEDNGVGMTPDIVRTAYVEVGTSTKRGTGAAGGFGTAKLAFMAGSRKIFMRTVAQEPDGSYTETVLVGTGTAALADDSDPTQGLLVRSGPINTVIDSGQADLAWRDLVDGAHPLLAAPWPSRDGAPIPGTRVYVAFDTGQGKAAVEEWMHMFTQTERLSSSPKASVSVEFSQWDFERRRQRAYSLDAVNSPLDGSKFEQVADQVVDPTLSSSEPTTYLIWQYTELVDTSETEAILMNNGLPQGIIPLAPKSVRNSQRLTTLARQPRYVLIDVRTSAQPGSKAYPWSSDRLKLNASALESLRRWYTDNVVQQQDANQKHNFRQMLASAQEVTSKHKYVNSYYENDAESSAPQAERRRELLAQWARAPWASALAWKIDDGYELLNRLLRYGSYTYSGLTTWPRFVGFDTNKQLFGVNIGVSVFSEDNPDADKYTRSIFLNPLAMAALAVKTAQRRWRYQNNLPADGDDVDATGTAGALARRPVLLAVVPFQERDGTRVRFGWRAHALDARSKREALLASMVGRWGTRYESLDSTTAAYPSVSEFLYYVRTSDTERDGVGDPPNFTRYDTPFTPDTHEFVLHPEVTFTQAYDEAELGQLGDIPLLALNQTRLAAPPSQVREALSQSPEQQALLAQGYRVYQVELVDTSHAVLGRVTERDDTLSKYIVAQTLRERSYSTWNAKRKKPKVLTSYVLAQSERDAYATVFAHTVFPNFVDITYTTTPSEGSDTAAADPDRALVEFAITSKFPMATGNRLVGSGARSYAPTASDTASEWGPQSLEKAIEDFKLSYVYNWVYNTQSLGSVMSAVDELLDEPRNFENLFGVSVAFTAPLESLTKQEQKQRERAAEELQLSPKLADVEQFRAALTTNAASMDARYKALVKRLFARYLAKTMIHEFVHEHETFHDEDFSKKFGFIISETHEELTNFLMEAMDSLDTYENLSSQLNDLSGLFSPDTAKAYKEFFESGNPDSAIYKQFGVADEAEYWSTENSQEQTNDRRSDVRARQSSPESLSTGSLERGRDARGQSDAAGLELRTDAERDGKPGRLRRPDDLRAAPRGVPNRSDLRGVAAPAIESGLLADDGGLPPVLGRDPGQETAPRGAAGSARAADGDVGVSAQAAGTQLRNAERPLDGRDRGLAAEPAGRGDPTELDIPRLLPEDELQATALPESPLGEARGMPSEDGLPPSLLPDDVLTDTPPSTLPARQAAELPIDLAATMADSEPLTLGEARGMPADEPEIGAQPLDAPRDANDPFDQVRAALARSRRRNARLNAILEHLDDEDAMVFEINAATVPGLGSIALNGLSPEVVATIYQLAQAGREHPDPVTQAEIEARAKALGADNEWLQARVDQDTTSAAVTVARAKQALMNAVAKLPEYLSQLMAETITLTDGRTMTVQQFFDAVKSNTLTDGLGQGTVLTEEQAMARLPEELKTRVFNAFRAVKQVGLTSVGLRRTAENLGRGLNMTRWAPTAARMQRVQAELASVASTVGEVNALAPRLLAGYRRYQELQTLDPETLTEDERAELANPTFGLTPDERERARAALLLVSEQLTPQGGDGLSAYLLDQSDEQTALTQQVVEEDPESEHKPLLQQTVRERWLRLDLTIRVAQARIDDADNERERLRVEREALPTSERAERARLLKLELAAQARMDADQLVLDESTRELQRWLRYVRDTAMARARLENARVTSMPRLVNAALDNEVDEATLNPAAMAEADKILDRTIGEELTLARDEDGPAGLDERGMPSSQTPDEGLTPQPSTPAPQSYEQALPEEPQSLLPIPEDVVAPPQPPSRTRTPSRQQPEKWLTPQQELDRAENPPRRRRPPVRLPPELQALYKRLTASFDPLDKRSKEMPRLRRALVKSTDKNDKRRVSGLYETGRELLRRLYITNLPEDRQALEDVHDKLNTTPLGQIVSNELHWLENNLERLGTRQEFMDERIQDLSELETLPAGTTGRRDKGTADRFTAWAKRMYHAERAILEKRLTRSYKSTLYSAQQQLREEEAEAVRDNSRAVKAYLSGLTKVRLLRAQQASLREQGLLTRADALTAEIDTRQAAAEANRAAAYAELDRLAGYNPTRAQQLDLKLQGQELLAALRSEETTDGAHSPETLAAFREVLQELMQLARESGDVRVARTKQGLVNALTTQQQAMALRQTRADERDQLQQLAAEARALAAVLGPRGAGSSSSRVSLSEFRPSLEPFFAQMRAIGERGETHAKQLADSIIRTGLTRWLGGKMVTGDEMDKLVLQIMTLDPANQRELMSLLSKIMQPTQLMLLREIASKSMLSGINTWWVGGTNFIGMLVGTVFDYTIMRGARATADLLTSRVSGRERQITFSDYGAGLKSGYAALNEGLRAWGRMLYYGYDPKELQRAKETADFSTIHQEYLLTAARDNPRVGPLKWMLLFQAGLLSYPHRFLRANQLLFRTFAYQTNLAELVAAKARQLSKEQGVEITPERVMREVHKYPELLERATGRADYASLESRLYTEQLVSSAVQRLTPSADRARGKRSRATELAQTAIAFEMPFLRAQNNMIWQSMEFTPGLGTAIQAVRLMHHVGNFKNATTEQQKDAALEQINTALAKAMGGLAIYGLAKMLMALGLLRQSEPPEDETRNEFLSFYPSNWNFFYPDSTGRLHQYNLQQLPFWGPLTMTATAIDRADRAQAKSKRQGKEQAWWDTFSETLGAGLRGALQVGAAQSSLAELTTTLNNFSGLSGMPPRMSKETLPDWLLGQGSDYVLAIYPNLLANFASVFDFYEREATNYMESITRRVGVGYDPARGQFITRQQLRPRRYLDGTPIENPQFGALRALLPITRSYPSPDDRLTRFVLTEGLNMPTAPSALTTTLENPATQRRRDVTIRLKRREQNTYQELIGQEWRKQMDAFMNAPAPAGLGPSGMTNGEYLNRLQEGEVRALLVDERRGTDTNPQARGTQTTPQYRLSRAYNDALRNAREMAQFKFFETLLENPTRAIELTKELYRQAQMPPPALSSEQIARERELLQQATAYFDQNRRGPSPTRDQDIQQIDAARRAANVPFRRGTNPSAELVTETDLQEFRRQLARKYFGMAFE